ncbi:MAG: serine/threonine protein kinase [Anaerosolibacter sp.]|uniref:AarF/UbiB family protein n=1 Tax=Anaerosolibacter sp. TaxID=1872527 RepID=UPI0026126CE4|nr:AarF/UbiB family protein [Anaerosolibacter sp.]MDF2546532.1 serine/threonine protein kinase [Anaerosolibacter sp.]
MYDFSSIQVKQISTLELQVENNSQYTFIDKGAQGAVFKIAEDKCVKIYGEKDNCDLEKKAYAAAQDSIIVPKVYETGENYIVMDYIDGPSLQKYLLRKGRITTNIAKQIVLITREMERVGFQRLDVAPRHVIVNKNKEFKVIDLVNVYIKKEPNPHRLFMELKRQNLVQSLMNEIKHIDKGLYEKWRLEMKEYLQN